MVVSVKEATQSRLQLLEDRKTLMKQLNDLKKKSRMTMVNTERDDLQQKTSGTPIFHFISESFKNFVTYLYLYDLFPIQSFSPNLIFATPKLLIFKSRL